MRNNITISHIKELTVAQRINLSHLLDYDTEYFLYCFDNHYNNSKSIINAKTIMNEITVCKIIELLINKYKAKFIIECLNDFNVTLYIKNERISFIDNILIDALWKCLKFHL